MDEREWDDDQEFTPPLPPDDRLWRHPSEVGAAMRGGPTLPSPPAPRFGLALMSALGGALIVAGLWLATTSLSSPDAGRRTVERVALQPLAAEPVVLSSDAWVEAVTREVANGVVAVTVERDGRNVRGSGVTYQIDGFILTSYRLVVGAESVSVTFADGSRHDAAVLGADPLSGIAVVKADVTDVPTAVLGIFGQARAGDDVVLVDAHRPPADAAIATITTVDSTVNVTARFGTAANVNLHGLLQIDRAITGGADGAALVGTTGAVVGIGIDLGTRNGGYAVPIWFARRVAQDIVDTGAARYAYLGIEGDDLTPGQAERLGIGGGAVIRSIVEGGPAHRAGLETGDVITALDDEQVWSMSRLILILRSKAPLRTFVLDYLHDGRPMRTTITLELRDTSGT